MMTVSTSLAPAAAGCGEGQPRWLRRAVGGHRSPALARSLSQLWWKWLDTRRYICVYGRPKPRIPISVQISD